MIKIDFTKKLLAWDRNFNKRSMPWKGETDPYKVWLSEIILQQTKVEQGLAYYEKFVSRFPTLKHLAKTPDKEIFKNWEGLGYYSRCRNLIATAKKIITEHRGIFPSTYTEILALPGIGPYTAAAISSFAFGLPYAVVDGNVERVLSRYFGVSIPAGSSAAKNFYNSIANELIDKKQPGKYNQAIMDFGATICKPKNPECVSCVLADQCVAYQKDWIKILPYKPIQSPRKKRLLYYFIVEDRKGKFWIRERMENDIWKNLYEFVLWETGKIIPHKKLALTSFFQERFGREVFDIVQVSSAYKQTLTHQLITGHFVHVKSKKSHPVFAGYQPVSRKQLLEFPFPKLISDYLKNIA